jgi:hypothetical protein
MSVFHPKSDIRGCNTRMGTVDPLQPLEHEIINVPTVLGRGVQNGHVAAGYRGPFHGVTIPPLACSKRMLVVNLQLCLREK